VAAGSRWVTPPLRPSQDTDNHTDNQ
jgi:hypothetical protein